MEESYLFVCDAEGTVGADLQRKLDLLNGTLDAERAEQARRQMQYIAHSGYSEDSDYTSDLNYPVGQHANCSASQFRSAAHQMHTPQRSLEVSRENSYERDEYHIHGDTDPLYYNSQPRTNRIDTWSQLHAQASIESAISWRTAADWQSQEDQRRPSLERQNTLYDDNMGYSYDGYTTSTHIRDHSNISQQPSYEEYYDSSSYPYQTSYVGDDSRQWDSGGQYFFDDGYGLTPTEYENIVNKRRSSVVQLPQVPPKQMVPSSRYSDYNEMAPYRPRPRRTTASLPATPSSTPKRGRALPVPPGSETGSVRSGRGRRLPRPPLAQLAQLTQLTYAAQAQAPAVSTPQHTHVPYLPEPEKTVTEPSYGYESYGYQPDYQDTATDLYQDNNFNTSYDEDGMQPFFAETPHATPPAAAQKPWTETETLNQFTYPVTSEEDSLLSKTITTSISSFLPQPPVTTQQQIYKDQNYQQYDYQFSNQQYQYDQQNQYQEPEYQEKQDLQVDQSHEEDKKQLLQSSVLTGAATLGSLMAGGAKKLGSFFGAAAAAVGAPAVSQPTSQAAVNTSTNQFTASVAPVTPFTSTVPVTASVPEVSPSMPVSVITTSAPISLPRTPSLRRQESIQRPPVRRTRTLPDAPDDLTQTSFDESAYEDEYNKTEYDQTTDRDRTSLDRYHEEDYIHDTIHEDVAGERRLSEAPSSPGIQKTASPTRTISQVRKPSVDSYHSQTPSIIDRRTSQSSFHHEEKLTVPTSQEESITEKSKVTFQDERTTYHEVPEVSEPFRNARESFDEQTDEYQDDTYHDDTYRDQDDNFQGDKYEDQEQFQSDEQYQEEDSVFQEDQGRIQKEQVDFKPEQPKLTPRQRWHRAYNKIIMQLNLSGGLLGSPVTTLNPSTSLVQFGCSI
ncbi:hypothetical protein K1T71_009349 [Dendrolimus kikuchii]|uniref:Uncharacterized protein n=1 Tax=Dendrolimus kikuchii TaxID=765133 RepID=A0ACC1CU54_9NEOP|nr:hypothetical protein K1T71_009349 [Dendrolimus kikuchii]